MKTEDKWRHIYLPAQGSNTYTLFFKKFYDEGIETTGINFNSVRVLRSYSNDETQREKELEEAVALYSFTLPLK